MNNQMVLSFPIQWACELIWVAVVVYIITVPVDGGSFFFSHLKFVKREIGSYQKIKSKYNPYPCTPTSFLRNVAARVILGWAIFFLLNLISLYIVVSIFSWKSWCIRNDNIISAIPNCSPIFQIPKLLFPTPPLFFPTFKSQI